MYSDGIRKGAIIVIVSAIVGSAIRATVDIVKRRKKKTQEKEITRKLKYLEELDQHSLFFLFFCILYSRKKHGLL